MQKKDPAPSDGRSVYEEFLRLPQERQKDLLRKWLRFFQKMLPRLEYQDFISDFKKACKSLQLRPVPARRKNARLRNLDPSHYHMLFEKIRQTRPRVISAYNKRKAREEQLLRQSFGAMIRRLIAGQPWPFVRGCRSKVRLAAVGGGLACEKGGWLERGEAGLSEGRLACRSVGWLERGEAGLSEGRLA